MVSSNLRTLITTEKTNKVTDNITIDEVVKEVKNFIVNKNKNSNKDISNRQMEQFIEEYVMDNIHKWNINTYKLPNGDMDKNKLLKTLIDSLLKFGLLEDPLNDPNITEIQGIGKWIIIVDKKGKGKWLTDETGRRVKWSNPEEQMTVLLRLFEGDTTAVTPTIQVVNGRTVQGYRLAVTHYTARSQSKYLDENNYCDFTLRKFEDSYIPMETLIKSKCFSDQMGRLLKFIVGNLSYAIIGSTGSGKAQPLTSKILTPTGYKLMKDIKIGDTVVDGDGNETKVLNVFPQGKRDIYKIHFNDNTFIEVADNHLNSVYQYNQSKKKIEHFDIETLDLIKLLKNNSYSLNVKMPILNCWKDNNIDINPYLLGCLIGDGSLHNNLGFANIDEDIINRVNSILDKDYNMYLHPISKNNKSDYRIRFKQKHQFGYYYSYKNSDYMTWKEFNVLLNNMGYFINQDVFRHFYKTHNTNKYQELFKDIKIKKNNLCVIGNTSKELKENKLKLKYSLNNYNLLCTAEHKHIPKNYLYSSYQTRLELLRGLMDTDGCISINKSKKGYEGCSFEYNTCSKQLSKDFEFLVRSLGAIDTVSIKKCSYKDKNGNIIKCKDSYRHYIKFSNDLIPVYCKRKKEKIRDRQIEPRRKITSIDYIGKKECQCIYVNSENHQYITDNLTVTHNTTLNRSLLNYIPPMTRTICIQQPTEIDLRVFKKNKYGERELTNNRLMWEASEDAKEFDETGKPVKTSNSLNNLMTACLRNTPKIISINEVRHPDECESAVLIGQAGHIVNLTFHAEDPEQGCSIFTNKVMSVTKQTYEVALMDTCNTFKFMISQVLMDDGSRKIVQLSEILGVDPKDHTKPLINDIYKFIVKNVKENEFGEIEEIQGIHVKVGNLSDKLKEKLALKGIIGKKLEELDPDKDSNPECSYTGKG